MKTARTFILVLLIIPFSLAAMAAPVEPTPKKLTQPNGTSFLATTYGDAWFNWKETQSGLVIVLDKKTGYYNYAVIRKVNGKKKLLPSGIQVDATGKPGAHAKAFDQVKRKDIQPLKKAAFKQRNTSKKPSLPPRP